MELRDGCVQSMVQTPGVRVRLGRDLETAFLDPETDTAGEMQRKPEGRKTRALKDSDAKPPSRCRIGKRSI